MAKSAHKLAVGQAPGFPGHVEFRPTQGPYVGSQELAFEVLLFPVEVSIRERLNHAKLRASEILISTNRVVGEAYRYVEEHAVDTLTNIASASVDLTNIARTRVERVKKEHPLRLLAVVGGTALLLGVGARIWRSRRHARQ